MVKVLVDAMPIYQLITTDDFDQPGYHLTIMRQSPIHNHND